MNTTPYHTESADSVKPIVSHHGHNHSNSSNKEIAYQDLDEIMERENNHNKTEIWSKLDKTQKLKKLHAYAEHYGHEHDMSQQETRALKSFFTDSLEKGRLSKVKDVVYNKERREIVSVPGLMDSTLAGEPRHFTLRTTDAKRVSTLKSLTLKRGEKPPPSDSPTSH